jgi:hypothetical protein
MASKVAICNMALGALGVGDQIANVDTERSAEARACRLFYAETLNEVLRDFPWPHAKKTVVLALVESAPNDEWAYSYRYPSDCLMMRRVLSGVRNDTRASRVPTSISNDDSGQLIFCDSADAELEYTFIADDPQRYPADFVAALAYLLAVRIAPMITAGDPFGLQNKNIQLYNFQIGKAKANAANEEQSDVEPEPETISGR